ncbi:MAG TPA: hypothetical protein P5110_03890, partial [Candidatus Omnitrophota bacterium]|nr:hypothetical protein [Candidatus Omnitrophota bacterium]
MLPARRDTEINPAFRRIGICALLLCAVLCAYLPSLTGGFIWDDQALVRDNLLIRRWSDAGKLFSGDIIAGAAMDSCFYRPLQMISYLVDYSLWRLRPAGFHLTGLVLHALAACAVYALIRTFWRRRTTALLGSLFFALHPVQTEAVAYIAGRADILCGLFVICAFIFHVRFDREKRLFDLAASVAAFACALLSKEYGLVFLLLIPLYHLIFRRKPRWSAVLAPCLVTAAYLIARFQAVSCATGAVPSSDFGQRLAGFFAALATYAGLIVVPVDLHMAYGQRIFSWMHPQVLAGIGLAAAIAVALIMLMRRQRRAEAFFLAWFAGSLLPQSNLYPINAYCAEHWLYLPLAGVCALVAHAAAALLRVRRFSWLVRLYLAITLIVLAALTWKQAQTWRTPVPFFERTARFAPESFAVQIELGRAYSDLGKHDLALAAFSKARDLA